MSENAVTTSPVQEKALEIIAQELELEASEFTLTGHFVDDYDADSLALIAVVARIEKELGVAIPKTELVKMVNLDAVFGLIDSYDSANGAAKEEVIGGA
jgi:acyl carrier protein